MKKENLKYIIIFIALIVIAPFAFMFYYFPLLPKAFIRYISDKDKGFHTFSDHLTSVRRNSWLFNKRYQEMRSKGTYVD